MNVMYPGYMPDYMGWMMLGSSLLWIAVIAIVAVSVVRLLRAADRVNSARSILDERLARGEIDAEEYRSRLASLRV